MYDLAEFGKWDSLPEEVEAILDHDFDLLEILLIRKILVPNDPIHLTADVCVMPLEIPVLTDDLTMVQFLLNKGANPNKSINEPILLTALRRSSQPIVELFINQVKTFDCKQKQLAFKQVFWGKHFEYVALLEEKGVFAKQYAGDAFRLAVIDGNFEFAKLVLSLGLSINYHEESVDFPTGSTALLEALRVGNMEMVNWLLHRKANLTISDKNGERPFTLALKQFNFELADRIKQREPARWHLVQEKLWLLTSYKVPIRMINHIKGKMHHVVKFPQEKYVQQVEFYKLFDIPVIPWQGKHYLSFIRELKNYPCYRVVWNIPTKDMWYIDTLRNEFYPLAKWKDFFTNPGYYLNAMVEGKLKPIAKKDDEDYI